MTNLENKNLESESKNGLTKDIVDNFTSENFDKVMNRIQKSKLSPEVQQSWPKWNKEAKDSIKKWYISLVANYLDDYKLLDSEVADTLIKNWYIEAVKSHLNSFVCDKNLAIVLVKNKHWEFIKWKLDLFKDVTANEIVNLCIEYKYKQPDIMLIFHDLLSNKNNIFDKNVAENLIEAGELWEMVKNLKSFEWLGKNIAENLIEADELWEMAKNLKSFEWLDKEKAELLVENWYLKNVVENKDTFDQAWKEYILDVRRKNNYCMAKDIDGKIKPTEEIIDRIISNVELPSGKKLSASDVKYIWSEDDIKWFDLTLTREDLKGYITVDHYCSNGYRVRHEYTQENFDVFQNLRIFIDQTSGKETFQIPGLEWLKFKDNEECLRVVNLLLWLKRNKYQWIEDSRDRLWKYKWVRWELERDNLEVPFDIDILKESTIDKYYPSIKNSQEFLDYINNRKLK